MSRSLELHIAPGSAAGTCIEQALALPVESVLGLQDVLSCGPLPQLDTIEEWRNVRNAYWSSLDTKFKFWFTDFDHDILTNTDALVAADLVTVWTGTGLADQLFLAWNLWLFRILSLHPKKLRIIQFSSNPTNGEEITEVGMLNPDNLKAHPSAKRLDDASLSSLDEVWAAVTASDPSRLLTLLAADPGPLPFIQRSLRSLVNRFPDVETGLGIWEMMLLRQVLEKGPAAVRVIGFAIIRGSDGLDLVGDLYLLGLLRKLGNPDLKQPLLSLTGNRGSMREMEVHLTAVGESVLSGEANFVTLNGIDEWVGGVHLDSSRGQVWFQRNGTLVAGPALGEGSAGG